MKHEVKTFKIRSWGGGDLLIAIHSFIEVWFQGYFQKRKMNYAWNNIIRKHFHDHQGKFVYCWAFNHSFAQNFRSFFKKWRLFLFKELSKIFKDFGGNFKDFSRISNNFSIQGLFKDMTLFQGLFRAHANHVSVNIKNNAEKDMTFFFSLKVWVLPN